MMSVKKEHILTTFLPVLFLFSVFLLALIKIEDPDTWLHLSIGRQIWDIKGLPKTEPFEYPLFGQPFQYTSWLFSLIYFAAYRLFDIHGVILLKAVLVCTCFFILYRDCQQPQKNTAIAVLILSLVVIIIRPRFTERPETFMLIFLAFTIYSLNAFLFDGKRYLYALPFVHLLWANIHSSIPLMFIPFLAFIFGGLLQRGLTNNDGLHEALSSTKLKTIVFVFIASFFASLVSPYFLDQYLYGTKVLSTSWYVQETMELATPTWSTHKWPFIFAPAVLLSFVLNRKRFSFIHMLLVIPFIVLSFSAIRFTILLCVVGGPVLTRNMAVSLREKKWWATISEKKNALASVTVVWIVLYTTLVFARVEPFVDAHHINSKIFGLGVNYDRYPEGALRYMDSRNITGRVFNAFAWGQYIIWRDYPGRTVYIDGRANLPERLLENLMLARLRPEVLEDLYHRYGFESVLIEYPVQEETAVPLASKKWALVYWDDLSLLYVRTGGKYAPSILRDEYHFVRPANTALSTRTLSGTAFGRTRLIGELKRNIELTGSSKAHAYLGQIYNDSGMYWEAINEFSHVRDFPTPQNHLFDRHAGMAYAYSMIGKLDVAIYLYLQALGIKDDPAVYYHIGKLYLQKKEVAAAVANLERSIAKDANFVYSYPALLSLYRNLDQKADAERVEKQYQKALQVQKSRTHLDAGLRAFADGDPGLARKEFQESIGADPMNAQAFYHMGLVSFNAGLMDEALGYEKRAVEIDPNHAMANYALAMIYRAKGNSAMERQYLERYLRNEPSGYFSRKAASDLKSFSAASEK